MTRLTDEEFHTWCQHNNIEPETATYIQRLRIAPPERKVRGRASKVRDVIPVKKWGSLSNLKANMSSYGGVAPWSATRMCWKCTINRRASILLGPQPTRPEQEPLLPVALDLATIPRYEEYR